MCGDRLPRGAREGRTSLDLVFPTPRRLAEADLRALGMPGARRAALHALAHAARRDPALFHPFGTIEEAIARLRSIRGVGEWTAQYIALRALREPDAFPASDIGLLRGAANGSGRRPTPRDLLQRAEPWRPWRAYAAQHLWTEDSTRSSRGEASHA
jgi:AraC family transcriptional regulator of adaptative response / DNA-3-methyladenine glycosylase II